MENKQTAVQWLIDHIKNPDGFPYSTPEELFHQAKEMEKQQIMDAHLTGLIRPLESEATKQAEQYYNETFKSNNNGN